MRLQIAADPLPFVQQFDDRVTDPQDTVKVV
jgi:hypothetical protein